MMRPDDVLLQAARAADTRAFEILWLRHRPAAVGLARTLTARIDPEDVALEAFAKVWAALRTGGGPTERFRPYLLAVVANVARTWGARWAREIPVAELSAEDDDWRHAEAL